MRCRRCSGCIVLIVTMFFLSTARAGWQSDPTPDETAIRSPFSLESADQATPQKKPAASASQSGSSSPFALPEDDTKSPAALSENSTSPFALPPEKESAPPKEAAPEESAADLLKRGTALAKEGKFEEARMALARSLEQEPENLVTLNNLGLVMRKLGRIEDAVKAYQFALEIDDTYALTYKNLGVLLENNGEKELAVQAYRKYCQLAAGARDSKSVAERADWLERRNGK